MDATSIIIRPLVSEKSNWLTGQARDGVRGGKYTFRVHKQATKTQIKAAVAELFKVKVLSVNTQNHEGKLRRSGQRYGRASDWKKAVVTLKDGERIDLF